MTINRRDFLKFSVLAGALATVARHLPKAAHASSGPQGERQWAMVIDQEKCIGCRRCSYACHANNDVSPDHDWTPVMDAPAVGDRRVYLPRPCMHCENAPCVEVCPVGASFYRDDGIVMMDYDRCIGCRYCQVACPYEARVFNWESFVDDNPYVPEWGEPDVARRPRGVPEKCSFCAHRIDRGLELGLTPGIDDPATPACCVACPTGARVFGDLNDPASAVSQLLRDHPSFRLREHLGTGPRVYYLPPRNNPEPEI